MKLVTYWSETLADMQSRPAEISIPREANKLNQYLFSDTFLAATCLVAGLVVVFPAIYLIIQWHEQRDNDINTNHQ